MLLSVFADEEFINSHHLLWRFVYSYISILSIRMRYYFAFKMGKKKIISYHKRLCVFFVLFHRLTIYLTYIHKHF